MDCQRIKAFFLLAALSTAAVFSTELWAAQISFTPKLTLGESYTDNVFLTRTGKLDDYLTTAGVDLTMDIVGRTSGLTLNYNPSYHTFANYSELNYWRHAARLLAYDDLGPNTRLQLTEDYLETEEPLDQTNAFLVDQTLQGPTVTTDYNRRNRNKYRTSVAEARLAHQWGYQDTAYLALQHRYFEEIDPPPDTVTDDNTVWQPSLGLQYWFVERWGMSFDGYYSYRDYSQQDDRQEYTGRTKLLHAFSRQLNGFVQYRHTYLHYDQEIDNDYTIYEPSIGITYTTGPRERISIGGGYYIQDIDHTDRNNEGIIINSEIYERWDFRSSFIDLTGSSGQRIDDTGTQDLGLNIYYEARLDFNHNFTQRLAGTIYGSYRYDDYPNQRPELETNTWTSGAGTTYQVLRWMFLGLNYDFRRYQSSINRDDYDENRVTLTVTLAPDSPYRLN